MSDHTIPRKQVIIIGMTANIKVVTITKRVLANCNSAIFELALLLVRLYPFKNDKNPKVATKINNEILIPKINVIEISQRK